MQERVEKWSPRALLAGVLVLSASPLLILEIFPRQLKFVMEPASYLVFHNMVEFFSIMVSLSMFGISWYTYEQSKNQHALFLGAAFLGIGLMDFMHAMSMVAMPDFFTPNDPQKSVQFWIPVRLFQAAAFLASAYVYSDHPIPWLSKRIMLASSLLVAGLVFTGMIFFQSHMPTFFVLGAGVTPLKKYCEYLVIGLLLAATAAYWRRMERTGDRLLIYYLAAFVVSIFSELPLAFYARSFDTYNLIGHINKIVAFFLIYYGIYRVSVKDPYLRLAEASEGLRREVDERKRAEEALRESHEELEKRVEERTGELQRANVALKVEIEGRSKFEQALQASEAKANALIKYAPTGIYEVDYRGPSFISVNDAICRILGYTREELFAMGPAPLLDEKGRALFADRIRRQLAGEKVEEAVEFRVRKKDGSFIDAILNVSLTGGDDPGRVLVVAYDITERKRMEEALRENEARYHSLFENMLDGFAYCEMFFDDHGHPKDFVYLEVNSAFSAFEKLTGLKDVIGKRFTEVIPGIKESHPELFEIYGRVAMTSQPERFEIDFAPLGAYLWISVYSPKLNHFVAIFENITERKRMEEELRRSRDELDLRVQERTAELKQQAELLDLANDAIVLEKVDGKILFWNDGAAEMYGWSKEEALGKIMRHLLQTEYPIPRDEILPKFFRDSAWEGELTHARKDGRKISVLSRWTLKRDGGGNPESIMIINHDLTERLKLEEHLRQVQRLESIGTLTGGIAHDFNNILGAVVINSEMTLLDLPLGSDLRSKAELILKAGERGRDLVKQMLLFSRKSEKKQEILSLTPLVKETFKMLRSTIPTTIQMKLHLETESDSVYADPSQIQQVIMNLCTNAAYAMRGTMGSIDISLRGITFGSIDVPEADMQAGDYLVLSVKDNGSGMNEEVRKRIFEPFFTTKPAGEGTGLGLSVAYGIVKNHKGNITVYSEPGRGSIFKVYLPKADTVVPASAEAPKPAPRGNERILLVDDEEINIKTVQTMLRYLGYQVTGLTDSKEALKLFSADPSQFDLVITDQTMPFFSGEDLGKEMMRIRPDIPVILCTGYSDIITSEKAASGGFRGYIMKPFTVREGAELVRSVLDQK